MKKKRVKRLGNCLFWAMCMTLVTLAGTIDAGTANASEVHSSTADHGKFAALDQDFATGQEVTKACLSCHTEAGKQFHKTYHWTWQSAGGVQKGIGKKNVLNNF